MGLAKALITGVIVISLWPIQVTAQRNPDIQLYYDLLNRVELLERELRQLRGTIETLQYRLQQGSQNPVLNSAAPPPSSGNQYQDLERRLRALEQASFTDSSRPPVASTNNPPLPSDTGIGIDNRSNLAITLDRAPPTLDEQEAYDIALGYLRDGRLEPAISAFQNFVVQYPSSKLLPDAYYWLGESYYVTRDFAQAKQAFLTLGSQYPESDKIPDTLLKLGYIYSESGDVEKAKQTLRTLMDTYPNSQAARLAQQRFQ